VTDDLEARPDDAAAPEEPTPPAPQETGPADTPTTAPRRKRPLWARISLWTLSVVVVLAIIVGLVGVWAVRRPFPSYDGKLQLKGLSAPVTVLRDDHAIPQLFAANAHDLYMAQGYVTAQERFWEMDFRRHVTGGRLSEMFGSSEVETDTYLRTMGWRRVAEAEWNLISAESRQYLTDYAAGVNAYLDGRSPGQVSLEYSVLALSNSSYKIEKWDPVDSLAWLKAMAWDLRGNMETEIERATLLASGLSRAQVESLYPDYPFATHKPIVYSGTVTGGAFAQNVPATGGGATHGESFTPPAQAATALAAVKRALDGIPALVGDNFPGIGSNSWVISGRLTATGKPILANDPHLSPSMPGIWYQMGLHCTCDVNAEGFTFSGVPGVVIGHNDRIAWGFTNLDPDVTDMYLEKLDGDRYQVDGQWRDLDKRTETIKVAGGKPVTVTIRTTNNGPLLSDASDDLRKIGAKPDVDPSGAPVQFWSAPPTPPTVPTAGAAQSYGVALRWTALDPGRTMDALFALNKAANWTDFRAAAALFEVPAQNIVYADVDGNIGYQSPGKIPVRRTGDGRWPAPGWDSRYDWAGYIPFAQLPNEENPPAGYIATANQAVIDPATYQPFLTDDWSYGYRSQRIMDMIEQASSGGAKISTADVSRMQFDSTNGFAAQITPVLSGESLNPDTDAYRAQKLFAGWDFTQPAGDQAGTARASAAAAFFNATWHQIALKTFGDQLPKDNLPDGDDRWFVVMDKLFADPSNAWWDDIRTPQVETRDDIVKSAMVDAAVELSKDQGDDPTGWRWGKMHTLTLENQSFGVSGIGPIEWLFNYGPVGVSGGSAIVNATGSNISEGYDVDAVPSMRMIVDLADLDASRWIQLTGESGHAFSAHYHDQLEMWRTGQTLPMAWNESHIKRDAKHTLRLTP
jgi:penicillin amidase